MEPGEYYELEKSSNGSDFQTLTKMEAKGLEISDYAYEDKNAEAGNSFYRLKMVRKKGVFNYSQTVNAFIRKGMNNENVIKGYPMRHLKVLK